MIFIKRHLIDVAEDAPVDEMTDEARQASNSVTFDLRKCHMNVFCSDLLRSIMQRVAEVLCVGKAALG